MKKSMLGIDIGTGSIKLVTNDQCVLIDTPENVFENDHFQDSSERTWHP